MCGRSSLDKTEKQLEERFNSTFYSEDLEKYNQLPSWNVAPSHMHPIVTMEDVNHFQFFKWGLVPSWAKDPSIGFKMINARIETITEKPSFKKAVVSRRCIIPFDGYYEWKKINKQKQPYRIITKDQDVFCVAGIYERWVSPLGESLHSFSLITQEATEKLRDIHSRMPCILTPETEMLWLNQELPPQQALKLLVPYDENQLHAYPVSSRVGNVRNNDSKLIEEIPLQSNENFDLFS